VFSQNVFDVHPVRWRRSRRQIGPLQDAWHSGSPMSRNKIACAGRRGGSRSSEWRRLRGQAVAKRVSALEHLETQLDRQGPTPRSALGASQVGYGPSMLSSSTSARRFGSFQVVVESSGAVAFAEGRRRGWSTRVAGDVGTVFVGDFTALAAPGVSHRDGLTARSAFLSTSDRSVRWAGPAVQRAFYYSGPSPPLPHPMPRGHGACKRRRQAPPVKMAGTTRATIHLQRHARQRAVLAVEAYSDFARPPTIPTSPSGQRSARSLDEARWDWSG